MRVYRRRLASRSASAEKGQALVARGCAGNKDLAACATIWLTVVAAVEVVMAEKADGPESRADYV